ncbi:DUF3306 domain-containing protein [Aurantimonas sp. A2-1-M11]|uniref:DUF3306 domain-containing protein n=1 Tax=Aurantimonas sp. A2-1-M11 TaxID=3113712 RepID=UPI002F949C83
MSNEFFSRWSRRKRELDEAADADRRADSERQTRDMGQKADPEAPASDVPGAPAPSGDAPVATADTPITPEELAALPDPDALTATSDVTAFLRKGVPASLRNRAMRRLWSLDPAIRDYVGDARDYAWDWNVPGGVPVSGPLSATTDVKQMVRDIFRREKAPAAGSGEPAAEADPLPTAHGSHGEPERRDTAADEVATARAAHPPTQSLEPAAPAHASPAERTIETASDAMAEPPQRRPRRHGGALPD